MIGAIAEFERFNLLERQREGIAIAKSQKKYSGRAPLSLDNWDEVYKEWQAKRISAVAACKLLGVSRGTFITECTGWRVKGMETVNNNIIDEFAFLLEDEENYEIKDSSVDLYSWCIKNGEYGKQILSEWSDRNLGNFGEKLNPRDVYDKDTRKYWWKCSVCGNEFNSQLYKRLYNHRGCPYCAPAKWGRSHSLRAAESGKSIRDYCSEVSYGNVLLKEWDNVRNAEAGHTLDNTTYASNQMTIGYALIVGKNMRRWHITG